MNCPKCNSEKVAKGRVFNQVDYVSPEAFFRPKELKPFSFFDIHIRIKKNDFSACAECGLVWATIEADKLTDIITKSGMASIKKKIGLKE